MNTVVVCYWPIKEFDSLVYVSFDPSFSTRFVQGDGILEHCYYFSFMSVAFSIQDWEGLLDTACS